MDITLGEGEKVTVSIAPNRRSTGRPGIFATPVTWTAAVTGDGNGIVVNVAEDRISAVIHGRVAGSIGTLSLAAVTLRGDEVSETHGITVTPPAADDFGVSVSEPVPDEAA